MKTFNKVYNCGKLSHTTTITANEAIILKIINVSFGITGERSHRLIMENSRATHCPLRASICRRPWVNDVWYIII